MAHPIEVNEAEFQAEVLGSTTPVLVDFWAEWCGPCKMIAPTIAKLASDYDGRVKVVKVDVEANPQLSGRFGVRGIPTLMIFRPGKPDPEEQIVGVLTEDRLVEKLDRVLQLA